MESINNEEKKPNYTCIMCKYSKTEPSDYPCNECSHNYLDKWENQR